MKSVLLNQVNLFNRHAFSLITNEDNVSIVKNFTEACIEIFNADSGFCWGKFDPTRQFKLIYKSKNTPKNYKFPHKNNSKEISIPISYGDHVYGSIVLTFKQKRSLLEEEQVLISVIGNFIAQAITINWLIEDQSKTLSLIEKQKETEVLLSQEKLKTEFIGNATHELRTPLAIMKGNVDLALMGKGDSLGTKQALEAVGTEITILSEILNDLSLLTSEKSRIKDIIATHTVDLNSLLTQVAKRLQTLADKKRIKITYKGTRGQLLVQGEKNYLEKAFLNIAKNAITYGKEGGYIKIAIKKVNGKIDIEIADNGVGISKEDLPRIFERFFRGDKAHTSGGNHSGLGLAIVKWTVEVHGGKVEVKSTLGKGTVFTISLPRKK